MHSQLLERAFCVYRNLVPALNHEIEIAGRANA